MAASREEHIARAELDSNCDTCSFGAGAYIVYDTGQKVSVDPFLNSLGSVDNVPVVTAAVAYDDPDTYQTYILIFNQALYFKTLDRHLLCPNQIRDYNFMVKETPLMYLPPELRTTNQHSIYSADPKDPTFIHIPLLLQGTTSYFQTRKPTHAEILNQTGACIHVQMTSDKPWDPSDATPSNVESTLRAGLVADGQSVRGRNIQALDQQDHHQLLQQSIPPSIQSHARRVARIRRVPWLV